MKVIRVLSVVSLLCFTFSSEAMMRRDAFSSPIRENEQNAASFVTPEKPKNAAVDLDADGSVVSTFDYSGEMNFQPGDFLFGMQKTRKRTLDELAKTLRLRGRAITVDAFNNLIVFSKLNPDSKIEEYVQLSDQSIKSELISPEDRNRFIRYAYHLINHPHYSPFKKVLSGESQWIRRACKAAVFFAKNTGQRVHFILDGLDDEGILNPVNPNYKSYTSSELRSIYKTFLGDRSILRNVIFYKGGVRLRMPPWLDESGMERQSWREYRQRKS